VAVEGKRGVPATGKPSRPIAPSLPRDTPVHAGSLSNRLCGPRRLIRKGRLPVDPLSQGVNNRGRDVCGDGPKGVVAMKAGWFQHAKSVFARPEPVPQTFSVPCDCGTTVQGERTEAAQRLPCPTCGQTVFVLPACVYPIPDSLRRRWSGIEEPAPEPMLKKKRGRKSAGKPESQPSGGRPPSPESSSIPWSQRRRDFSVAMASQITPVRMIAAGVCLSVTLMGYVLVRQARWSRAQASVQASIDAGTEALHDGRLTEAAKALGEASVSLDILGRHDDVANSIRRLAREAQVGDGLVAEGLPQLLSELFELHDSDTVAGRFARRYSGQWILFDAPLYAVAEENRKSPRAVQLEMPLLIGDKLIEVRLDDYPWPVLLSGSTEAAPKRVIFAAQLDRLELATKQRDSVLIWLRGDTAVLWSERETLDALDLLPVDAEELTMAENLLSDQRDLLKARE
jgi:hypothetical protein